MGTPSLGAGAKGSAGPALPYACWRAAAAVVEVIDAVISPPADTERRGHVPLLHCQEESWLFHGGREGKEEDGLRFQPNCFLNIRGLLTSDTFVALSRALSPCCFARPCREPRRWRNIKILKCEMRSYPELDLKLPELLHNPDLYPRYTVQLKCHRLCFPVPRPLIIL